MGIKFEDGIVNRGNQERLKQVFRRAIAGEKITIAFLGGSITQGSLASDPSLCYAARTFRWWEKTFPQAQFTYINAGIGATDSQFGCARVESDVLAYEPDVVSIEFAVNDASNTHYLETYEGLIRKVYGSEKKPAVYLFYNVCYDNGSSAELQHAKVARHYRLPAFSMRTTIYPLLVNGEVENRTITPDDLHPNDLGHEMVADVITYGLNRILNELELPEEHAPALPAPLTVNGYEDSIRYQNMAAKICSNQGFAADHTVQNHITEIFRNGWEAKELGSTITFEVEGSCIGIQYRKTMQLPAPVATVKLDGIEVCKLDANFDETWGDKLVLDTILDHGMPGKHLVEISLTETHKEDRLPFYLVSVIVSGKSLEYAEPLFLNPVLTHNIWGGSRLREEYGYEVEGNDVGECWGISAHPNGEGTIRGGIFDGQKLSTLWETFPELFGNRGGNGKQLLSYDRFPLLTKIIDAKDDLSIQVHPDDSYAKEHENGSFGKTECWYVMDCPDNASLVIGHNAKTHEELEQMIHGGQWDAFIREIPVKKGDFLQIDPGTVHAIKGGLLILETQQNSDITYRVYDYDRLQNGKPRQLHVEQSIDVITVPAKSVEDSVKHAAQIPENQVVELYSCDYYIVNKISVQGEMEFAQQAPFLAMSILEGTGTVNGNPVKKGDHLLLPHGVKKVHLSGQMELITSTIPRR